MVLAAWYITVLSLGQGPCEGKDRKEEGQKRIKSEIPR